MKLDYGEIFVMSTDANLATGLKKFGAIIGDRTEIGCNAVVNPGTVIGRDCIIYPSVNVRGVIPRAHIVKVRQELQTMKRRDLL